MLRRLFDRESPFAAVPQDNPLFRSEARQVKWGATPAQLWRSSWPIIAVSVALLLLVWALTLLMIVISPRPTNSAGLPLNVDEPLWSLIVTLLFAFTLFDTLLLGMIGIWNGLNTFNDDITAGRWDLLRLTPVPPEAVINARYAFTYAFTQLRTWRVLMLVIGVRIGLMLLAVLTIFVPPLLFPGWRGILTPLLNADERPAIPILYIVTLIPAALAWSGVFVVEPLWRLRLIAAGSIALAVRMRPTPLMILYGVWRVVIIALLQSIVVFLVSAIVAGVGLLIWIPIIGGVAGVALAIACAKTMRSFYGGQIGQWKIHTIKQMHILWDLPFVPVPDSSLHISTKRD
jgi:hypothetical protein